MRNKIITMLISFVLVIIIFIVFLYKFFEIHTVEFNLVKNLKSIDNNEFHPDAYGFFHTENDINKFFQINKDTMSYYEQCKNIVFDFENFSYLIVYGAKIEQVYWSYKTTFFDDKSPSYAKARRFGNICVFINYKEDTIKDNAVYIYKVEKNEKFRGFNGI